MMQIATNSRTPRPAPASAVAVGCAGALALAVLVSACADKGFTPPRQQFSPKVSLQITITADQQAGFGPRFLVAAAGFDGEGGDDGGLLGHAVIPFTTGTHQMTVPVDLSPCLAYRSLKGKDACPLLIGALITQDTAFLADTASGDLFREAFDYHVNGPYMVGPGSVLPTIPPIDLSVSRLGVVKWAGDNALQLGGDATPYGFSGPITGVPGAGAAAPTLIAVTQGHLFPADHGKAAEGPYPQVAVLQDGIWKRVTASVLPTGSAPFTDVAAISASEAYVAHRTGLYRFDGSAIAKVAAVTDSILSVASVTSGASAKHVIAGGWNGVVWVGNTQTWQRYVLPSAQTLNGGVCITGPNEAFAASTTGGGLFRFDGTTWTSVSATTTTAGKMNLQCPAPGQAFVMAADGQRLSWNGSGWTVLPNTGLGFGRSVTWGVVSPTEIYSASDSASVDRAFYRFNGTSWQEVGRLRFTESVREPWVDPRGAAYFASAGFGRVEKVSGTSVSVVSYQPTLRDVIMTSLSSAFVVGSNLLLARWDGISWTVDAPPKGLLAFRSYRGVWSDGPKNAWAIGDANGVIRYDGNAWSVVGSSTAPAGVADSYNGVWGTGADVWAVGDASILHCKASGSCVNEPTGGAGALHSVWGVSGTNVFAVGTGGRIVRYNGTAWTAMASPTNRTLRRVSGSSATNVWAVGDSTVLRFDGTQWAIAPDSGELRHLLNRFGSRPEGFPNHVGLWVRGPKEVYFTTDNGDLGRYDGRRWDSVGPEGFLHTMTGVSGLPDGCGLAITEGQTDPHRPTLWRGIASNGCFTAPMGAPTKWP